MQADGKILIGGQFTTLSPNGGAAVARNRIARLNADGTLDATFNPNANNIVFSIAVQADGKILLGGQFTTLAPNGGAAVTRNRIARLNADGTLDATFDPNASNIVYSISVQTDGKILIGGVFTTLSPNGGAAVARNFIARLNADGTLDATFDPSPNSVTRSIALQADGKILLGGLFQTLSPNGGAAVARNFIARVNADGTLDASFDPNTNGFVLSISLQADGRILPGGAFGTFSPNGGAAVSRNSIARLNADGTLDATFDPNVDGTVYSIAVQTDGKILIGGDFDSLSPNGAAAVPRNFSARLSNDTAALQNLAVTQTTIIWTRGGSSPQLTRVTFEYSNDNLSYSPLGNGTSSGSNWSRTGLNLSTGRNFYIRARGYYRSGYVNGSESMTESVRNAFFAGPTAADSTISGSITTPEGAPLAGAVIQLSGSQTRQTITDVSGSYRFANVETYGFYTVTPARVNYSFNPFYRSFSLVGKNTEAVFTGSLLGETTNPLDTAEYFVRQQYLDILGREPDEPGLNFWSNQINQCLSSQSSVVSSQSDCLRAKRIDVAAAFFISVENQESGLYLYDVYASALGRPPAFGEFAADRGRVVGGDGLDAAKAAFAQSFVQRTEFTAKYPVTMTAEAFVDALLQSAAASFSNFSSLNDARANLISIYNLGGDPNTSRAAVLRSLADNESFKQSQYNQAFVLTEYFAYLHRDIDQGGYDYWVNVLNSGDRSNYSGMVCSFITSTEYQRLFSAVVSRSNGECGN